VKSLFWLLALREWRHHPWRHGVALLAVALGVALAYSVHLINQSALAEFSAAVRTANGEPDVTLRGAREGFDDALFDRIATDPDVALASPVLEVDTYAQGPAASASAASAPALEGLRASGRIPVRVLGLDLLRAAPLAPALTPKPAEGEDRLVFLDPSAAFPNPSARSATQVAEGGLLKLQAGNRWVPLRVAGTTAAGGTALVVMDLAGAQQAFGQIGRISRIDVRLQPGVERADWLRRTELPLGVQARAADDTEQRVSNLSRAYRVNLTVLALVALFVGAFLVFAGPAIVANLRSSFS
jgi:putative ABC transport system permease protein